MEETQNKTETVQDNKIKTITKAAAALEVKKQVKVSFSLCLAGVGASFIITLLTSANIILGTIGAALASVMFGYFGFKSKQYEKYLNTAYDLK